MIDVETLLDKMELALPALSTAPAAYVGYKRAGNLVFVSGQLPLKDGKPAATGRLGREIATEQGRKLAELCALNVLAQLKAAIGGDWSRVVQVVRVGGFVACAPDYVEAQKCINGASELLLALFGENGTHARAAVGVMSLPLDVPVEVEAVFEITG